MGSGKEENAEPGWTTPGLLQSLLSLRGLSKLEMAKLINRIRNLGLPWWRSG